MTRDAADTPDFRKRYDVLLDISRILTATLEPGQLYRAIYEQASRVLETTGFYISLYDERADQAEVVFYADRGELGRPGVTYRGSESRAIRESRPLLEDLDAPERAVVLLGPESDEEVTRSVMSAPMLREGRVLGVISAQSYSADAYMAADLQLLQAIADHAAVAVENARAVKDLERQRRESDRLEEVGRLLSSSLELDEVLQRIVVAIQELAAADGAGVWLLRADGTAEVAMTAGDLALPAGTTMPVPDALHDRLLGDRKPLIFDFREHEPLLPLEIRRLIRTESGIAVPLVTGDRLIGALSVSHAARREYAAEDIRLLERFAFQAAIAVSNARLHEQVRFLSLTDPLTELPNRRHMAVYLEKEFAAAERGRPLTVVLFDLDGFKRFNDTAGHQAGDEVLQRFGRVLVAQTRAMNLAARYGGDEFICILSDTDEEGGRAHTARVVNAVRADPRLSAIGVSAGMATYTPDMVHPEELIRKADKALYEAKARRRRDLATS